MKCLFDDFLGHCCKRMIYPVRAYCSTLWIHTYGSFPSLEPVCSSMSSSWPAYRFLRRQVRWPGIHITLRIFRSCCDPHKDFGVVNKAEVDIFLKLSCFLYDPADVGNLISCSSASSKSSLNIWKFTVHKRLKPGLENFVHYFARVWDECNCAVVEHSLALPLFGSGMKTDLFQSWGQSWVLQIYWHIECSPFTASSFTIWNSSTGSPWPILALFIVMLPKAHLTSHFRMSSSRWVITPSWLSVVYYLYFPQTMENS